MSGHKTLVPHASAPPALFGYIRRLIDAARQRATSAVIHVAEYLTSFPPHELPAERLQQATARARMKNWTRWRSVMLFPLKPLGRQSDFLFVNYKLQY